MCFMYRVSDPKSWERNTNEKILRSQDMRKQSETVRNSLQLLLQRSSEGLLNQWRIVNAAFSDRIKEYMEAKDRLQAHIAKVHHLFTFVYMLLPKELVPINVCFLKI